MMQPQFVILPIVALVLLATGVSLLVLYYRTRRPGSYGVGHTKDGLGFTSALLTGAGTIVAIITLVLMIPFAPKYWMIYHRTGTVSTVSNQFVSGSGEYTSTSFVATLKGDRTPYLLDDPRASLLPGSRATLTCTIEFVYAGGDRWNCVIGEVAR